MLLHSIKHGIQTFNANGFNRVSENFFSGEGKENTKIRSKMIAVYTMLESMQMQTLPFH